MCSGLLRPALKVSTSDGSWNLSVFLVSASSAYSTHLSSGLALLTPRRRQHDSGIGPRQPEHRAPWEPWEQLLAHRWKPVESNRWRSLLVDQHHHQSS